MVDHKIDETAGGRAMAIAICRVIGVGQAVFAAVVFFTRFIEPAEFIAAIMLLSAAIAFFLTPWVLRRVWQRQGY